MKAHFENESTFWKWKHNLNGNAVSLRPVLALIVQKLFCRNHKFFIIELRFHFQNVLSFSKCAFIFKMCFQFQNVHLFSKWACNFKMCSHFQNVLSFSKCAFIFKMCFHFQNELTVQIYKLWASQGLAKHKSSLLHLRVAH